MAPKIIVIGAGVMGMSSAVCIQEACPQAQVQIVADQFSPDTTSDGSAGFWKPYLMSQDGADRATKLSEQTFEYLMDLANSSLSSQVKVQRLSGYIFYRNAKMEKAGWQKVVDDYRVMGERELRRFPAAEHGSFFTTLTVDVPAYMDWLLARFKAQGGTIRQMKVSSISELPACDVLVNCSGLSSRHLFKDPSIYPIRGQVLKVQAPWVKHFYKMVDGNSLISVMPGVDYITIGSTVDKGSWDTTPDDKTGEELWQKALHFFPFLEGMKLLRQWVGLRPARNTVRLEAESFNHHGRSIKVVHNYGHGGSGITMHWGCALEVTKMVEDALKATKEDVKKGNLIVSRL